MGDSRRKKQALNSHLCAVRAAAERVGPALSKLALAASDRLGFDCLLHAAMGQRLLADVGISSELIVGCAAWRVGPGDGDVVAHVFQVKGYLPPGAEFGFPYHAWLRSGDVVIDFTTYQLRRKAAELDALDEGCTTVQWCPEFLVEPVSNISAYSAVAAAPEAGLFCYEHIPQLQTRVQASTVWDHDEDLTIARLIMANPNMQVMGPNNLMEPTATS